jgi:hypothetical protein
MVSILTAIANAIFHVIDKSLESIIKIRKLSCQGQIFAHQG